MTEVNLSGTVEYAKVFRPDSYLDGPPRYSLNLFLDDSSWALYEGLKLKNKVRENDQGRYVKFSRDHNPKEWEGKVIFKGGPPEVVKADGSEWDGKLIGNGSKVTVKLSIYKSKMGPGSRIVKVRVDELVEYNPDGPEVQTAVPF